MLVLRDLVVEPARKRRTIDDAQRGLLQRLGKHPVFAEQVGQRQVREFFIVAAHGRAANRLQNDGGKIAAGKAELLAVAIDRADVRRNVALIEPCAPRPHPVPVDGSMTRNVTYGV